MNKNIKYILIGAIIVLILFAINVKLALGFIVGICIGSLIEKAGLN